MNSKQLNKLLKILKENYPNSHTALKYNYPWQLLIATILSAQCTDKMVNQVTPALFEKYESLEDFADASLTELQKDIRRIGFYRNKAKFIINSAKILVKDFQGKIPKKLEDLIKLPGVARKTANVVLYNAFGIISGVTVDTHVKRISYRLGLTSNDDPTKIENDLMKVLPKASWGQFPHAIILHGRAVCQARKPACSQCFLSELCPQKGVIKKK